MSVSQFLIARDRRTGIYIAHAVPFKGAGVEWICKQMLRDVRKCGYHGRVVFRTDGELAILDLMGEVARLCETCRLCWNMEPLGTAIVMGVWRGQFDQSRT